MNNKNPECFRNIMRLDQDTASRWLSLVNVFLEQFGWLADSFVLDFYVDNHWGKLPKCWADYLDKLDPNQLALLLDFNSSSWDWSPCIPPLSLLAFRQTIRVLSIPRRRNEYPLDINHECPEVSPDIKNLFTRHVKLKKRHEVEKMGEVITSLSRLTNSTHVYDIGAGLGHLSRYLTYAYGLNLTCVDSNEEFGVGATKFDVELEKYLSKKQSCSPSHQSIAPSHKNLYLELNKHEHYLQNLDHVFGLTGLHSCGNLSPVILHNYVNSPARFVVSVGCCYMKMDSHGFPLSSSARNLGMKLTYEALEVACHAIEQYCDRLTSHVNKLKTHSYRASLETILVSEYGIKRAGLRSVPHTESLSFIEYASRAVKSLNLVISIDSLTTPEIQTNLEHWFRVVLFYSLRLLVANVVESAVLLDRALFLIEKSHDNVSLVPLFDPKISPRTHAVISWK